MRTHYHRIPGIEGQGREGKDLPWRRKSKWGTRSSVFSQPVLPASAGRGWCVPVGLGPASSSGKGPRGALPSREDARLWALPSGGLWRTAGLPSQSLLRGIPRQGWRQRLKVTDKDSVLGREDAQSSFRPIQSTKAPVMGAVGTRSLRSRVLLGHSEESPNRLEYPRPLGNKQRQTNST